MVSHHSRRTATKTVAFCFQFVIVMGLQVNVNVHKWSTGKSGLPSTQFPLVILFYTLHVDIKMRTLALVQCICLCSVILWICVRRPLQSWYRTNSITAMIPQRASYHYPLPPCVLQLCIFNRVIFYCNKKLYLFLFTGVGFGHLKTELNYLFTSFLPVLNNYTAVHYESTTFPQSFWSFNRTRAGCSQ